MARAALFPGQGSQFAGMGKDLVSAWPEAQAVFDEADATLGFALSTLCFEGPEEDLKLTANTQPAILTVSVAAWRVLAARGFTPAAGAGHSLGEYSAWVAAGSLAFGDAVRIVRERGRLMQEAVPVGAGAMAAVMGVDDAVVAQVCAEAAQGEVVSPANFNSPGQVVIAGDKAAVERAVEIAKGKGARRSMLLPVSAPFHCALMAPAQAGLKPVLDAAPFAAAAFPVVNNADAKPVTGGSEARAGLVRQVCASVRWVESVQELARMGCNEAFEIGPGKVLAGLVKRIAPDMAVRSLGTAADLDAFLKETC